MNESGISLWPYSLPYCNFEGNGRNGGVVEKWRGTGSAPLLTKNSP